MARILLASPDSMILASFAAEFAGAGHEVVEAADGMEACDEAERGEFDLILLDRNLPVFDGLETCMRLRANPDLAPALPVVLISGEDVSQQTLDKAGITEAIPKRLEGGSLRELSVALLGAQAGVL